MKTISFALLIAVGLAYGAPAPEPADSPKAVDTPASAEKVKEPQAAPAATPAVEKAKAPEAAAPIPAEKAKPVEAPAVTETLATAVSSNVRCPDGMIGITAKPGRILKRAHSFCIDQYEFPNRAGKFPVANISWLQARQLCTERGVRLCTDAEWTTACRGPEEWKYPYGKKYDKEKCVTHNKYLVKVGSREACRSVYGVYDMVGNVSEWTGSGGVVSLGGSWNDGKSARCTQWKTGEIDRPQKDVGFRCCANPAR